MQPHLWQFLALTFAGSVNRSQQDAIEYLKEENRVLREQLGDRRLRFTDDQRRSLAAKAKGVCRENLKEIADLVTPDTLLRWYRELIAAKYDGRRAPRSRATSRGRNDTRTRAHDGEGKFKLGLYEDLWGSREHGP